MSARELAQLDDSKKENINRALRETSRLKSWFNLNPTRFLENNDPGMEHETFEEVYYHPNLKDSVKWINKF
jgi:hypothetical protein